MERKGLHLTRHFLILITALLWLVSGLTFETFATTIIDTGQPPIPTGSYGWSYHSNSISEVGWAAEFTLNQASVVTDIQTYMINRYPGLATWAIYADGGNVPDVNNTLFRGNFSTSNLPLDTYGWYGLSGLAWNLSSGTYWVAFEARAKDGFYSCLPWDAPHPMDNYAAYVGSGNYLNQGNAGIGLRISGNTVVPEPATLLLVGSGLIGLVGLRKKLKTW